MTITPTSQNASAAKTAPEAKNQTVSATDFLTLLVKQLQNQDPLKPQDGTQFLSQLAEINNVQQLTQINQTLTNLASSVNSK